jgi:hypothetical protein
VQRSGELTGGDAGLDEVVAVCLVDGDDIGEFEHPLLDALQPVTGAGDHQQQERVDHIGDGRLALADADGLDDDDVEASGLDDHDRFSRRLGDTAEDAGARRGPDEGVLVDGQL